MKRLLPAMGFASLALLTTSAGPAVAARTTGLTINPAVGPPTTMTKAKGTGFADGEVVAFYVDGARVGSVLAGPTGKFNTRIRIPASARPGNHGVEAVGQSSGDSARAVFLVRTDWLQGCFDGGRGCFNPYENVLDRVTVSQLALAWRAPVGTDGMTSPVYANGKVFVGTEGGLVGLDPTTGAIIINYRSSPVTSTPAVIKGFDPQPDPPGKVIFGSADGVLHAVSTDGRPLWQVGLGVAPGSPLVIQGIGDPSIRVVVGAGNTLFAVDGDGNRQWAAVLEGGDISTPPVLLAVPGAPTRIVAAAGDRLYLLDAATGATLWSTSTSGAQLGAPAVGPEHRGGPEHPGRRPGREPLLARPRIGPGRGDVLRSWCRHGIARCR